MFEKVKGSNLKLLFGCIISILLLLVCVQTSSAALPNNRICGDLKLGDGNLAPAGGLSVKINIADSDGTIVKSTSVKIKEKTNSVFYDISYIPNGQYYIYYEMKFNPQYEPKGYYVLGSGRKSGWTVIDKPKYPQSIYNMQVTNANITIPIATNNRYITGNISLPRVDQSAGYDIEVIAFQQETAGNFSKLSSTTVHIDQGKLSISYAIATPNVDRNYIIGYKLLDYYVSTYVKEGYYSSNGTILSDKGNIPVDKATRVSSSSASKINLTVLPNIMGNATAAVVSPGDGTAFRSGPVLLSGTYQDNENGVSSIWVVVKNETTGKYLGDYSFVNSEGTTEFYNKASYSDGKWSLNLSSNLESGNYIVKVYAYDGQNSTNPAVSRFRITISRNATAEIKSLENNAVLKTGPVTVTGTAIDLVDGIEDITGVKITIQGAVDNSAAFLDAKTKTWIKKQVPFNETVYSNGNWSLDLSGVDFPAGKYWITAYANDGDDGLASGRVTFTVEP